MRIDIPKNLTLSEVGANINPCSSTPCVKHKAERHNYVDTCANFRED